MGLFSKKICSVCGEDCGRIFVRKLEDGNLCKDCTKKLSPFFSERRHSTVEDIRAQLAYREANLADVEAFHATQTFGSGTKVYIDEAAGKFLVSSARSWKDENPDVIPLSAVTGCVCNVDEKKTEIKRDGPDGKKISYNPPRYDYDYDFNVVINVDTPWFDEIRFRLNPATIDRFGSAEYRQCEQQGRELCEALTRVRQDIRDKAAADAAPKAAVTCPHCGATTFADANGCCEYCGGSLNG